MREVVEHHRLDPIKRWAPNTAMLFPLTCHLTPNMCHFGGFSSAGSPLLTQPTQTAVCMSVHLDLLSICPPFWTGPDPHS